MPLKNVRYRRKGKMRLAFRSDRVVEAKNMETGEIHTEAEMREDDKRSRIKRARKRK